jgi:hypothetical protein
MPPDSSRAPHPVAPVSGSATGSGTPAIAASACAGSLAA